jgi:dTDP-4-dehydrorhamnose 3,5-epimerase-like enzyme
MSIDNCKIIELPKIQDPRGNLTFIESGKHVPFEIKRIFYLYDVPGGETRAGHALKTCYQLVSAIMGSFDVVLDDGRSRKTFHLNRAYQAILIPPAIWRELENFSSGAVCLVVASEPYSEGAYYRSYDEYLRALKAQVSPDAEPIA